MNVPHRRVPKSIQVPSATRSATLLCSQPISSTGFGFVLPARACVPCLGREIKGEGFNVLWSEASRAQIADLVIAVVNEASCVVAGVNGRTEKGAETELELLLLPLGHDRRTRVRALGTLAPLVRPY